MSEDGRRPRESSGAETWQTCPDLAQSVIWAGDIVAPDITLAVPSKMT